MAGNALTPLLSREEFRQMYLQTLAHEARNQAFNLQANIDWSMTGDTEQEAALAGTLAAMPRMQVDSEAQQYLRALVVPRDFQWVYSRLNLDMKKWVILNYAKVAEVLTKMGQRPASGALFLSTMASMYQYFNTNSAASVADYNAAVLEESKRNAAPPNVNVGTVPVAPVSDSPMPNVTSVRTTPLTIQERLQSLRDQGLSDVPFSGRQPAPPPTPRQRRNPNPIPGPVKGDDEGRLADTVNPMREIRMERDERGLMRQEDFESSLRENEMKERQQMGAEDQLSAALRQTPPPPPPSRPLPLPFSKPADPGRKPAPPIAPMPADEKPFSISPGAEKKRTKVPQAKNRSSKVEKVEPEEDEIVAKMVDLAKAVTSSADDKAVRKEKGQVIVNDYVNNQTGDIRTNRVKALKKRGGMGSDLSSYRGKYFYGGGMDSFGGAMEKQRKKASDHKRRYLSGAGAVRTGVKAADHGWQQFGKYILARRDLDDGSNLHIRYTNGQKINAIPPVAVGGGMKAVLSTIADGKSPTYSQLSKISDGEKSYIQNVLSKASLDPAIFTKRSKTEKESNKNRFEILKGQIVAGNDNPEIIKEFKHILVSMRKSKELPADQVTEILMELSSLGH